MEAAVGCWAEEMAVAVMEAALAVVPVESKEVAVMEARGAAAKMVQVGGTRPVARVAAVEEAPEVVETGEAVTAVEQAAAMEVAVMVVEMVEEAVAEPEGSLCQPTR